MRTAVQSGAKNCESGGGRPAGHSGFIARVSCSLHGCPLICQLCTFGHRFRLGLSIAPPFGFRSASLALPTS